MSGVLSTGRTVTSTVLPSAQLAHTRGLGGGEPDRRVLGHGAVDEVA